ncbi:MAG TPA: DUF3024 domain-containing protein [Sulfurospirillum arcachonense]|nr:DUF3024 domain-containing protein [Sulfurospirillum arcachonense]
MTIPPIQKQLAQKQLEKFCSMRIPLEVQDQIKMDYSIEENVVTLIEKRPRWDDHATEWTQMHIAYMIYDKPTMRWQLYWIRGNGKKVLYDDLPPQNDLQKCIDEIDADPLGTFWG